MRPATTGDTEKGRSMKEISRLLPGKSNFAIDHEAAMPKTMLSGTLMPATRSVRLIAASESGPVKELPNAVASVESASPKTDASGRQRKSAKKNKETTKQHKRGEESEYA